MSGQQESSDEGDAPAFYLMPVAAVFGMYAALATIRALYQIYRNLTYNATTATAEQKVSPPKPLKSGGFLLLLLSIVGSVLAYGYVVAQVNNSIASSQVFDPFDILAIDPSSNSTVVKQAFRSLSKIHHPDKGGDEDTFHKITLAYKALTDATSRENWEKFGHPDGPQTQTLSFALPDWLLHPTGTTALVLVLLYLGMFVGIILWVVRFARQTEKKAAESAHSMSVAGADTAYLAMSLSPTSSHLDVLFAVATTPESIEIATKDIENAEELRKERRELLEKRKAEDKKSGGKIEFDMDDGEWADDDEEDEEAKAKALAAQKADEEKARAAAQLAAATGKTVRAENVKLEGIDDGALGQEWVEARLKDAGVWPPPMNGVKDGKTFKDEKTGDVVGPMEHQAIRRNLCMTMGRLNAMALNTHDDLVTASQKGLIDPTYFKSTMQFRQRTGLLLEACLRFAISTRSYNLAKTIIEAVSMFKIGTMSPNDPKTLEWFRETMKKQYKGDEGIPCLGINSKNIETPDEDEIATGDVCALTVDIERKHAESFTKQKLELCQKQGIPPQVALQTYREGWWILVRAKKIGGDDSPRQDGDAKEEAVEEKKSPSNPMLQALDGEMTKQFDAEVDENRLVTAWPFIVSNIAQKSGKVKVQFKAPAEPGKYRFYVAVKSQEFLGTDQEFTVERDVVDQADVQRKEEEEEGEDDEHNDDEDDDDEDEEDDDNGDDSVEQESKKTK